MLTWAVAWMAGVMFKAALKAREPGEDVTVTSIGYPVTIAIMGDVLITAIVAYALTR